MLIKNILILLFLMPFTLYCMDDENNSNPYSLEPTKITAFKETFKKAQEKRERKKTFRQKLSNVLNRYNIAKLKKLKTHPSLTEFSKKKQQKIKTKINREIAHLVYEHDYDLNLPVIIYNFWPFKGRLHAERLKEQHDEETIGAIHDHVIEAIKWNGEKLVKCACERDACSRTGSRLVDVLKLLVSDNILFLLEKKPEYIPLIFNPIIKNNSLKNVPTIVPQGDNRQLLQFYISDVKSQLIAQVEAGIIKPKKISADQYLTKPDSDTIYNREIFSSQEIASIASRAPSSKKTKKSQTLVDICKNTLKTDIEQQLRENDIAKSKDLLNRLADTYCINDWLREWDANTEPKNIFSRKTIINSEQILFKLLLADATKNGKIKRLAALAKDPILETFSSDHLAIIKSTIQDYSRPKKIAKCFLKIHVKPQLNNNESLDVDFLKKTYLDNHGYTEPEILTAIITKIEKYYAKNIIDPTIFSRKMKHLIRLTNLEKLKDKPSDKHISHYSRIPAVAKRTQLALEIFATKKLNNNVQRDHKNKIVVNNSDQSISTENFNQLYKDNTIDFYTKKPCPETGLLYLQI